MQDSIHSIQRVALVGSHIRPDGVGGALLLCTVLVSPKHVCPRYHSHHPRMDAAPRSEWSLSTPRLIRHQIGALQVAALRNQLRRVTPSRAPTPACGP